MKNRVKTSFYSICLLVLGFTQSGFGATYEDDDREVLYWKAPMDPNYRSDRPGKSPMGMDLVPVYAEEIDSGNGIKIAPEVIQNLGVRTTMAVNQSLSRLIETVGYIAYDEARLAHIHLRTEGWIEKLTVRSVGERVSKDQRLFDFYSPELVNAQEEFVQALELGNSNLVTASRDRLTALGVSQPVIKKLESTRQVMQTIPIYSPQDGVVSELAVREGMYISPAVRVMELADLSSVWLLADVFERQSAWVTVGQDAKVTLGYLPGHEWLGKVEYIYPELDADTRTLKVRLRFENHGEMLKPNMYAQVQIHAAATGPTTVIPIEALIRTGSEDRVIVALGNGRYGARVVSVGIESGDLVEILQGINVGEQVVISGQFLIDSEASLNASIRRMGSGPKTASTASVPDQTPLTASATGIVESVMAGHGMITIAHGPINELQWPAMEMNFTTLDGIKLDAIKAGSRVDFELLRQDDKWVISAISVNASKHTNGDTDQ